MKKQFCCYCGEPLGNCDCEHLAWLEEEDRLSRFYDEYQEDPVVQEGWRQQDLIDLRRMER